MAAALVAWLGGSSAAQEPANAMLFDYPEAAISRLERANTPAVVKSAQAISAQWNFIADSFSDVGPPPTTFLLAMEHNKKLLQRASEQPGDVRSLEIVQYVAADLAIKSDYIKDKSLNAIVSPTIYGEVAVDVRTVRNGGEVDGYFIGFSPRYLAGGDPLIKFNNPTNPSEGSLPPGRYEMIAILNNEVVQRQEVSIGVLGQTDKPIICLVP